MCVIQLHVAFEYSRHVNSELVHWFFLFVELTLESWCAFIYPHQKCVDTLNINHSVSASVYMFINIVYDVISIAHRCPFLTQTPIWFLGLCVRFASLLFCAEYIVGIWDMISDNQPHWISVSLDWMESSLCHDLGSFNFSFDTMPIIDIYSLSIMNCIELNW